MSEFLTAVPMLLKLGLAVYEAVRSGDRSKTVGEIFEGVRTDMSEIERLRLDALERLR